MSSDNIARLIFGLILFVCLLINGKNYLEYKTVIEKEKPVEYTVVKTYYTVGRGRSYHMDATFQGRAYKLDITKRIADNIDTNIYPAVYYVKRSDKLITNWNTTLSLRIVILSSILIILCCIPFNKFIGKAKPLS
jgi:hypothetical protein